MATPSPVRLAQRLLRRVGLETRSRSADLRASIARADERVEKAKRLFRRSHTEMLQWKEKCRTLMERQAAWQVRQDEQEQTIARQLENEFKHKLAALQRQYEREAAAVRLQEVSERVAQAERSIQHGRQYLSALEVKLDLVDGAINTLDRRFRTVVTQAAEPGD